jgi:hypothetical protein
VSAENLEALFPSLRQTSYSITSPASDFPNCVGWALRSDLNFEPRLSNFIGGYYWPDGIRRDDSVEAWIELFELHGYRRCDSADLEEGIEKIAIYSDSNGEALHVARQLSSGEWTSKIGKLEDIRHRALDDLAGRDYGHVSVLMRR